MEELLFPGSGYDPADLEKVNDILDVWFDSGSTQYAVLKSGKYDAGESPADIYLEGSDQHRGWFQSSLLIGCATGEHAPYKSLITHGFTVDEQGNKMSKSKGNGVEPQEVCSKNGSEILRLWVALSDYQGDMKLGQNILKQVSDQYRKLRNTFRFLLANIADLETPLAAEELGALDKWILARAGKVFGEAEKAFEAYDFAKGLHRINSFLTVELSGIYLDVCKDRFYCDDKNGQRRRSAQSAVFYIARSLLGLAAPVLTYTCDEVVEHAPAVLKGEAKSIFDFQYVPVPEVESGFDDESMTSVRDAFFLKVDELKKAGTIKNTLELEVATGSQKVHALEEGDRADWFTVSAVTREAAGETLAVFEADGSTFTILRSAAHKCPRCWKQTASADGELCPRCAGVMG